MFASLLFNSLALIISNSAGKSLECDSIEGNTWLIDL